MENPLRFHATSRSRIYCHHARITAIVVSQAHGNSLGNHRRRLQRTYHHTRKNFHGRCRMVVSRKTAISQLYHLVSSRRDHLIRLGDDFLPTPFLSSQKNSTHHHPTRRSLTRRLRTYRPRPQHRHATSRLRPPSLLARENPPKFPPRPAARKPTSRYSRIPHETRFNGQHDSLARAGRNACAKYLGRKNLFASDWGLGT